MKRLALFLALTLGACAGGISPPASIPAAPIDLADKTTLDEATVIAFDQSVTVAANLAELAIRTGAVKGDAALNRVADASRRARAAVIALHAAYDAGNATSYAAAIRSAREAINAVQAAAMGDVR